MSMHTPHSASDTEQSRLLTPYSVVSHMINEHERQWHNSIYYFIIETAYSRIVVIILLFFICFIALGARMLNLMVLNATTSPNASSYSIHTQDTDLTQLRSNIIDRNGTLLTTTLKTSSLYANPGQMLDKGEAAEMLSTVLNNMSAESLFKLFSKKRHFIWIKRHLSPRIEKQINLLGIPGLHFIEEQRRVYPHGALFAHVVGATNVDNNGLLGIELSHNTQLSSGATSNLQLSLDIRIQHAMRDELLQSQKKFKAKAAGGLVMNVNTGEIIAMVSLPDFDPNMVFSATDEQKFNRITLGVYELGSIFKPLIIAQALELNIINLDSTYDATKPIIVPGGHIINDYHGKKRWLSVPEIFVHSSNIGIAKIALDVGTTQQSAFLEKLELNQSLQFEINEIGRPLFPTVWRKARAMTVSFGHGIAVSPLQGARTLNAIINGGLLKPVTLIPVLTDNMTLEEKQAVASKGIRIISEETSKKMRQMFRLLVSSSNRGHYKKIADYAFGGKTGTAEKSIVGGYDRNRLLNSYVGVVPINKPEYLIYVLLDEPQGNESTFGFASAGWTAAPTVTKIIARIAPLLGIEPINKEVLEKMMSIDTLSKKNRL